MQVENRDSNFSNIQLELLKMYSTDVKDKELLEIKNFLSDYFSKKSIKEADEIWDKTGLSNDNMDRWLNEQ